MDDSFDSPFCILHPLVLNPRPPSTDAKLHSLQVVASTTNLDILLFGLFNTPATLARLMDAVLKALFWETYLVYLDNIIIFGCTWEEHLRLRQVLICI